MARLPVLVVACLVAVSAAVVRAEQSQLSAQAESDDSALGGGAVRVLLEMSEQSARDAQFEQHVSSLVTGLHAQAAGAGSADATVVVDVEDHSGAEDVMAAAAVAEASIADELEAEGVDSTDRDQVFGEAPEHVPEIFEAEAAPINDDAEVNAGPAFVETDADADADASAEDEEHEQERVFGEAPAEAVEIVEAIPSEASLADDAEWEAGPALIQLLDAEEDEAQADEEDAADDEVDAEVEADAEDETEAQDEAEDAAEEDSEDVDAAFVQVRGDWKDPPVWWKAPEEEMANADQQPWPLDPNFPMSVLDPPPNLPLANIDDPNNYPPMADPNLAFNIDPSAFPQTNSKVGTDDPSFASFSINGR